MDVEEYRQRGILFSHYSRQVVAFPCSPSFLTSLRLIGVGKLGNGSLRK